MMRIVFVLIMLALAGLLPSSSASITLETRPRAGKIEISGLRDRIQAVLSRTEKRIKEVFGLKPDVSAILESSDASPGFQLTITGGPSPRKHDATLLINSRIVKGYSAEELRIAAARVLFEAVWPKYRKAYSTDDALTERLYTEGMTAYAAELVFPGSARWEYSGVPDKQGDHNYQQYLKQEQALAEDVISKFGVAERREIVKRLFADDAAGPASGVRYSGRLLS
jgi:hypothetical protein